MPWNRIYYPEGKLTQDEKDIIAKGITDVYGETYPRSATLVAFFPFEHNGFYKGGKVCNTHFRITQQHMGGSYSVNDLENNVRKRMREVWKPFIDDRGMTYELQIEEIPAAEISFDNFLTTSLLATSLYREMVEENTLFELKTVKG